MSTTSRDFFERMYTATADPWSFASSEYEQRYATILGFVPAGEFSSVFEPGCSIGELTVKLAERCGFVTAIDIAEAAVETALQRCSHLTNVDVRQGSLGVERAATSIVDLYGRALGPRPLIQDAAIVRRIGELQLYIRQHHDEHDLESIGRQLRGETSTN